MAMQDVYDFFYDVNSHLTVKGLQRLDDMLRPAIMSGLLSDMLTASLATRHNAYFTKFFMCGFWTVTSPHRHSEANYFSPSFQTGIC